MYSDTHPTSLPVAIETQRLQLDAIRPEIINPKEMYDFITTSEDLEETIQYVPFSRYDTTKDAERFVKQSGEEWKNGEKVAYMITVKGDTEYAGTTSFNPRWNKRDATFGIWLRKPYWGNEYSAERGEVFLELAFEELGLEFIEVCAAVGNQKSQKAIEKYINKNGGQHEGQLRHYVVGDDGEPFDVERYTITVEEWNRGQ